MQRQRYLFLYLKTGGGHLAPARAVANILQGSQAERVEPILVDGLAESPRFVRAMIEDGYRLLQSHARWYYALIYLLNTFSPIAWFTSTIVSWCVRPYLERMIAEHRPDKIVIFHFFLIDPVRAIQRKRAANFRTLVVVTDPFTAHPIWFRDREQHFIVFSERLRQHCLERGIARHQVVVFPFIINEQFDPCATAECIEGVKQRLGFDPQRRLVLIVGGGDGIPKGVRIVRHLLRGNSAVQIAVVCGHNGFMRKRLLALKEKQRAGRLSVFGFVDNIHEFLTAADLVITKCGASMCMEILRSNKIPLVSSYLWGQEKGNVEFLLESRMGIYERKPAHIPEVVSRLFAEPERVDTMKKSIATARIANGASAVAGYILSFPQPAM
jgi:UDP-N-acetylglucosamine:LPS N-acetylglucosamine transferase